MDSRPLSVLYHKIIEHFIVENYWVFILVRYIYSYIENDMNVFVLFFLIYIQTCALLKYVLVCSSICATPF